MKLSPFRPLVTVLHCSNKGPLLNNTKSQFYQLNTLAIYLHSILCTTTVPSKSIAQIVCCFMIFRTAWFSHQDLSGRLCTFWQLTSSFYILIGTRVIDDSERSDNKHFIYFNCSQFKSEVWICSLITFLWFSTPERIYQILLDNNFVLFYLLCSFLN